MRLGAFLGLQLCQILTSAKTFYHHLLAMCNSAAAAAHVSHLLSSLRAGMGYMWVRSRAERDPIMDDDPLNMWRYSPGEKLWTRARSQGKCYPNSSEPNPLYSSWLHEWT